MQDHLSSSEGSVKDLKQKLQSLMEQKQVLETEHKAVQVPFKSCPAKAQCTSLQQRFERLNGQL